MPCWRECRWWRTVQEVPKKLNICPVIPQFHFRVYIHGNGSLELNSHARCSANHNSQVRPRDEWEDNGVSTNTHTVEYCPGFKKEESQPFAMIPRHLQDTTRRDISRERHALHGLIYM